MVTVRRPPKCAPAVQMERAEGRALMVLIAGTWWGSWLHHSPNESMDPIARQIAAGQGTRAGFPDYILPIAMNGFPGLAFELKAPKPWGRAPSLSQKRWLDHFSDNGWQTGVAYGAEEARRLLFDFIKL